MANWGWSTGTTGYDDEDRLVSWDRDDNNLSQDWTLTNEGDWSQFVENTTTENRTHGPAHGLQSISVGGNQYNLGHDVKGNLTDIPSGLRPTASRLSWDFDNRMSAADTDGDNVDDVTLKYDAQGRRIAKTSGTTTTVYVLSGWQVVVEYSSGAAPTPPTEKYVYASYIDEPVLKDGTGRTVYYHRNSQYSVSALTSASGAVVERYGYEPYGELTILAADGSTVRASSSYGNSNTYTGRRWDAELTLYYFRARYYDPGLGRFVGRDPLGYVDGSAGPLYANRFIRGMMGADPSGLAACSDLLCTRTGPHEAIVESFLVVKASVSGRKCGDDAKVAFWYYESTNLGNGRCGHPVNGERDAVLPSPGLRFGNIVKRSCNITSPKYNKDADGCWEISLRIECPLRCINGSCQPEVHEFGVYGPYDEGDDPDIDKASYTGNPTYGVSSYSRHISASIKYSAKGCCVFNCRVTLSAWWERFFFDEYVMPPIHSEFPERPRRDDWPQDSYGPYLDALENYYRRMGWRRKRRGTEQNPCTAEQKQRGERRVSML